jgi:hypothetical protein
VGIGQPTEDQRLDEGGAGEPALALEETGLLGGLVGAGGQDGLQGVGYLGKFLRVMY